MDRGDSQGARPQGADRAGEGAAGLAGARQLMEAALGVGAADDAVAVLRETTPFGDASEALLQRIAAIARPASYGAGARIYGAGDAADDIFVVVSGRAEHVFKPEVGAREALKRVTRGGVFGLAGLLLGPTQRLATATPAEPTA